MRLVPLREVATIQLGKMLSPKAKTGTESYPYLRNLNLQWGRFDLRDLETMDFNAWERAKFELQDGDLLVCEGGEPGRCAVWREEVKNCYYQKAIHRVRPFQGTADSDFLALWIRFHALTGTFEDKNAKTTIAHLPLVRLEQMLVPVLDFQHQRTIAAHLKGQLAELETARRAVQVQWKEAQVLKIKALESVFDGIDDWRPIGSVASLQSGYAFKSDSFKRTGVRLLRNANILPGKVYWDDAVFLSEEDAQHYPGYVLSVGDVLISLDRPIISGGIKVARVIETDLPALLLQRVGRFLLDPENLDADYLYSFLQTDSFISEISGHEQSLGVPHISPSQVEAIEIPLPNVTTQRQLAKRMKEITEAWSVATRGLQTQLDDLSVLSQRLLAQAFEN